MKNILQTLALVGVACAAGLSTTGAQAQDRQRGRPDASQIQEWQQRRMDSLKDQLEIKDDTEWKAIQPLVQKVMDSQRTVMADRLRGSFGRSGRGGDRGGDRNGDSNSNSGDRSRSGSPFGSPSPESETLQKAVDGKASNSEIKAALAKYQESRKEKMAEMEKAQADLRKVLSVRQEAIASLAGLL